MGWFALVRVFVVYDTKYGNTKLVAERIVKGMEEVKGIEVVIGDVEEIAPEELVDYDAILIGTPNHIGGPAWTIKRFIDKLGKLDLKAKWYAVFDTYLGGNFEKAVKKTEKRIHERIPKLKRIASGLSIKVQGMKGPVLEEELPKCREFGRNIATQLQKNKG